MLSRIQVFQNSSARRTLRPDKLSISTDPFISLDNIQYHILSCLGRYQKRNDRRLLTETKSQSTKTQMIIYIGTHIISMNPDPKCFRSLCLKSVYILPTQYGTHLVVENPVVFHHIQSCWIYRWSKGFFPGAFDFIDVGHNP
jgi:hypothetical protein